MGAYDIDPAGVASVVVATDAVAAEFEGHTTELGTALDAAAGACGSDLVVGAIAEFVTTKAPAVEFLFTRTGACLTGALDATRAYEVGDDEMAASAVAAATGGPDPRPVLPRGGGLARV